MEYILCKCGIKYVEPIVLPIKCYCGNTIKQSDEKVKVAIEFKNPILIEKEYSCSFRKEIVGLSDCECLGKKEVFKCELHELCMVRKLKPGVPTVEFKDGSKEKREIVYCNVCQDRDDSESCCGN